MVKPLYLYVLLVSRKFIWLQDSPKSEKYQFDQTCFESLAFLAFETIGNLVEAALKIRHEECTSDTLLRSMVRRVYAQLSKDKRRINSLHF